MSRSTVAFLLVITAGLAFGGSAFAELPAGARPLATDAPHPLSLIVQQAVEVGIAVLVVGAVLCLYRTLRGPRLADRVIAMDAFALHIVGLVIVLAIYQQTTHFLDVALVVAIIGFAGTLAFSQYIAAKGPEGVEDSGPRSAGRERSRS